MFTEDTEHGILFYVILCGVLQVRIYMFLLLLLALWLFLYMKSQYWHISQLSCSFLESNTCILTCWLWGSDCGWRPSPGQLLSFLSSAVPEERTRGKRIFHIATLIARAWSRKDRMFRWECVKKFVRARILIWLWRTTAYSSPRLLGFMIDEFPCS